MPKTKKRLREAAQPEPICTDKKERKIKKTKKNKKAKLAEMISRAAVPLSTRKLLVIDLNKVLISRKPMTSFYSIRPHAREFLSEMAKLFDLAVWTSMTNTSAKPIIRDLFVADCLVFRWYQSKCTIDSDDAATVEDKKPNFVKQLSKVWEEFPQYNHTNTVLVDDTESKCVHNPIYTTILPYPYDYAEIFSSRNYSNVDSRSTTEDVELAKDGPLWLYLEKLGNFNGTIDDYHAKYGSYVYKT